MKKSIKVIVITITAILLSYTIFIIEESFRISNNTNSKPLIILKEEKTTNQTTYESIGFKLINKYGQSQTNTSDKLVCVGQEIWLFNNFLIWGWIS